jgi:chorismate dehydratase
MVSSPMMKLTLGYLPYLNSEPFYFGLDRERFEFVSLTPSAMTKAAKEKRLDVAGPLPLVACFQSEDVVAPLGDFCIATGEAAQSILLFSRKPIEEMDGHIFGITAETTTSVQLLKVLLHCRYQIQPKAFVGLEDEHDAFLLIGDNALRQRVPKPPYSCLYDLGREWRTWTGYPFVFARWVVRKDLPQETQEYLRDMLHSSLEKGLANLSIIARQRRDLNMTEEEVVKYLKSIRYVLGPEEQAAIRHFRELLRSMPAEEPWGAPALSPL